MSSLERRFKQVSEIIATTLMESMLDFRHNTNQTASLWEAIDTLNPALEELDRHLERMVEKHKLNDNLINDFRNQQSATCYVVGIIAGLHLAGRSDLIAKMAEIYADTTQEGLTWAYDEDGDPKGQRH